MSNEKKWRIIITRRDDEQRLVKAFMRKEIQSFCPCCSFSSIHNAHVLSEKRPLFPSLLFLYIDEEEIKTVSQTRGVINFLFWRNAPALVPHKDISHIYSFTNCFSNIQLEKCEINEDLMYNSSAIGENEKNGTVTVQLNSIGYRLVAKKENYYLQELGLPVLRASYKLPAFSLNNALNLAMV